MENQKVVDELIIGSEGVQEVVKEATATKLTLLHDKHPMLAMVIPAYEFGKSDQSIRNALVKQMVEIMDMFRGIGLSANQVGLYSRLFVMRRMEEYAKNGITGPWKDVLVCFNPVVIQQLEPPKAGREGCLSFPGLALQVTRPGGVLVQFEDESGALHEMELFGIDARCFQHELDHLNGIVFTKRVKQQGILSWELEKQRKLIKKARKNYERHQRLAAL